MRGRCRGGACRARRHRRKCPPLENRTLQQEDEQRLVASAKELLHAAVEPFVAIPAANSDRAAVPAILTAHVKTSAGVLQWWELACHREPEPWKCDPPLLKQFINTTVVDRRQAAPRGADLWPGIDAAERRAACRAGADDFLRPRLAGAGPAHRACWIRAGAPLSAAPATPAGRSPCMSASVPTAGRTRSRWRMSQSTSSSGLAPAAAPSPAGTGGSSSSRWRAALALYFALGFAHHRGMINRAMGGLSRCCSRCRAQFTA